MSDFKMPDMNQIMDMAKKMQGDMSKKQEELSKMECEASAGGGMVKLKMNGAYEMTSLELDKAVVDPNDLEMLQDLIIAAVNQATTKVQDLTKAEMGKFTGGMSIPGMPDLS